MARLIAPNGSIVNLPDEKAARLGWPRYESPDSAAPAPAKAKKTAPAKKAAAPKTGVLTSSDVLPKGT